MTDPARGTTSQRNRIAHKFMQSFSAVHRFLYRQTGGKIGKNFRGGKTLLLTTT